MMALDAVNLLKKLEPHLSPGSEGKVLAELLTFQPTVPAPSGVDTEAAGAAPTSPVTEQWQMSGAEERDAAWEKLKAETSASAPSTDGKTPIASDDPIKNMPSSARQRAEVRMGQRNGAGRP